MSAWASAWMPVSSTAPAGTGRGGGSTGGDAQRLDVLGDVGMRCASAAVLTISRAAPARTAILAELFQQRRAPRRVRG